MSDLRRTAGRDGNQRTTVVAENDLDCGPAPATLLFDLGTAENEIDLSTANAGRLRAKEAPAN